jgi:transcriptional regulator with XRE-family HTH domain
MKENDVKRIGERIFMIRTKMNMRQAEFARQLEVSQPAVIKWKEGRCIPKGETLIQIYQVFGASPDWILLGIEKS